METKQQPTGLSVAEVAAVTGLERGEIYRVQAILALGAPAHFHYFAAGQIFTFAGLCQLAEGLAICGHAVAAAALRVKLAELRSAVAPAPAGWMAQLESREDAA